MKKILVIVQSETVGKVAQLVLSEEGHSVEVQTIAEAARKALEKAKWDLVIAETGRGTAASLEAALKQSGAPVLRLVDGGSGANGAAPGSVLTKPFQSDQMLAAVRKSIGKGTPRAASSSAGDGPSTKKSGCALFGVLAAAATLAAILFLLQIA